MIFLYLLYISIILVAARASINSDVQRHLDVSNAMLKMTVDIKAKNIKDEYKICFPDRLAYRLSMLTASMKGQEIPLSEPQTDGHYTFFTLTLNETEAIFKFVAIFTDILEQYPREISQNDNQKVLFKENVYFTSPYHTEKQKTIVKLASASVESFTKAEPYSHRGSSLVYGPFQEIGPLQNFPLTVHYMNNKPFMKLTEVGREIEVSHWGNVAVEETYDLTHAGAKLSGGFSRFDYQHASSVSPSFRSLRTKLPREAHSIYYRDQIGNISSSSIQTLKSSIALDIETRFPMFGGWQTEFYIGYSLPTESILAIDANGRYILRFSFFAGFEGAWAEDMETKIILPEGSFDIRVDSPYPIEQSTSIRYTFLDSELNGGRPVLIIKAKNIIEEHNKEIRVSYEFRRSRMIAEPIMLMVAFFTFYTVCMVLTRL
mmetsp:Transcript_14306/g.21418  ORF Transcript_14306/g.21418 Transcript_14306/m.21418 type:complete len:431 (+) Transcript_14306:129-1421(+)